MKFSQKMPLNFFYNTVQNSQKWPKTLIKGSCLKNTTKRSGPKTEPSLEVRQKKLDVH